MGISFAVTNVFSCELKSDMPNFNVGGRIFV